MLHGEANTFDGDMADGPQSPPLQRPTTAHTGLELPCKKLTSDLTFSCVFLRVNGINFVFGSEIR